MQVILFCKKCKEYTLEEYCPKCHEKAIDSRPAKFSIEDKYGYYRRLTKKNVSNWKNKRY